MRVAAFLNADAEGIAFVPNATTGVSTVLASLRFQPGDELLASDHEYNATLNALRAAAERDGATLRIVRIPFPIHDPSEAVEAYVHAVTPRTRFALVSHVTSPTALVLPVVAIVRELDRRGVDTLVDGAHAPGMVEVDLGALNAAYWTGNGHKWLCGPKGSGVLHVRADLRDRIRPLVISHGANDDRTDRSRFRLLFDWLGTTDPTPYLALPAAIRYTGGHPRRRLEGPDDGQRGPRPAGSGHPVRRARDDGPVADAMLGSMAAVPLPGIAPTRAAAQRLQAELFDEDRIEVPIIPFPVPAALDGGGPTQVLVRISAQVYNRPDEYVALAGDARAPPESLGARARCSAASAAASPSSRRPLGAAAPSSAPGRPRPRRRPRRAGTCAGRRSS